MSASPYVQMLTENVYQVVRALVPDDHEKAAVTLRDGGVLITSADGEHIHVLVQPIHFVPGPELPF